MQGILLELPLAAFFVKKLQGRACDVNDLPSLDPQLYASLMTLRGYQGNVEDLSLFFSVASPDNPLKEVSRDCRFWSVGPAALQAGGPCLLGACVVHETVSCPRGVCGAVWA